MKKKTLTLTIAALLLVVSVIGGTLAYFTDKTDTKENTFTVGNVKIELTEPNWDKEGSEDAPEVYAGEPLKKDPTVENTGANPCFVRIKVEGLDSLVPTGADEDTAAAMMIKYRTNYVDDALNEGWVLHTDGFFYYNKPLGLDEKTPALFDQIVMPTALENGDASTEYSVDVTAEAVQAQGAKPSWSAVNDMTVEEIAAWFVTAFK